MNFVAEDFKSVIDTYLKILLLLHVFWVQSFEISADISTSLGRLGLKLQTSAETTGDEYIRVGIVQETSTYECLEVRRRVRTTGDEYIRVPRGQETSTYDRRRVHTSA